VHVHTTLSDGGGTPEDVVAAAKAAGLRFVVITDHNNLDAKPAEGYRDGVLVLVGTEISTTAGHLLGLGIPDPVFRFSGDARDGLEDVRDLGGFALAAHPLNPRPDLRFTGWDLPGAWGLELWNGDSEWRSAGARVWLTAAAYGLNHRYALLQSLSPPGATLARWDSMLAVRDVPAIAGADAHSRLPVAKKLTLPLPSYESVFDLMRNHVVLDRPLRGDAEGDGRTVLDALRRGRSYVGLDALAPADDFSLTVTGEGRRATMGDSVAFAPGLTLQAGGRMPAGTRLRLLRDGRAVHEATGTLSVPLESPGVYRVEARVPGWTIPWVLTNAIAVLPPETLRARLAAAAWPDPEAPPKPAAMLDDFPGRTAFAPEFDPSSAVDARVLDPGAGPDGGPAARLAFRLGVPSPKQPFTWCALVDRQARDLSGRTGLAFWIRGDREYRVWVQVRDRNPASADEGLEWWMASVRTAPEWREVVLPFARFRSINPKSDGRLDLDKVQALVFVIDGAAVKTGTAGTIGLAGLGVY
jgi:hypothetical protein